ncbi:MAG: hypothetical protein J6S85_02980 [Methanobrevibacter sp.]|nr:hypothetical protein [Methanobrevibacter sp.]
MKIKLEQVKEFLANTKIGDKICVYQLNGTGHYLAAHYFKRVGTYNGIKQNKYGTDCISVLVGEKKKNYMIRMNLEDDMENCHDIKGIERI